MLIYAASGRGQLSAMAEARGGARAGPFPGRAVVSHACRVEECAYLHGSRVMY